MIPNVAMSPLPLPNPNRRIALAHEARPRCPSALRGCRGCPPG